MKKIGIYARVSTADKQDLDTQLIPLQEYANRRGWQVFKIYTDKISGSKESRPSLDALMRDAHKRKFDCVLVFRFDRMGRSSRHLIQLLETFQNFGIDFISYNESVDTTTPAGKMLFTMISAFAEFERSIIQERVRAGLAKAKAKGKKLGRPKARIDIEKLKGLRSEGLSIRKIAKMLNIPSSTCQNYLKF